MIFKNLIRKMAIGALVLLLAGVAAENLDAQDPGYFISDDGGQGRLGTAVLNVDGSNRYNVLPNTLAAPPPGFNGGCSLAEPPDGHWLGGLFPSVPRGGSVIAYERLFTGQPPVARVYVINPDGTALRQVTFPDDFPDRGDINPVISPDGTMIAFVSRRNASNTPQVFTVNVDGTGLQQITLEGIGFNVVGVAWSPDSTQLAFSGFNFPAGTCPFPNEGLKIINADGTGERVLACSRNGAAAAIDWSPDGTRIGFVDAFGLAGRDGLGISQVSPDGTRLGDITPEQLGTLPGGNGGLHNSDPGAFRYSPDSTRLAYVIDSPSGGPQGISLINLDGIGKQDIINDGNPHHIWWQSGPAILTPTTLTLGPDPLAIGPTFAQQLSAVLKDSAGNILSRSAFGFCTADFRFAHANETGLVSSPGSGPATPMIIENGGLASNLITAIPQPSDPPVGFRPATWDFGNQSVTSSSATQVFTLTNTGSAVLNINAISLVGDNAADFAFDSGVTTCPLGGGPVAVGDSCVIGVAFSPSDTGARTAQISVDDDAAGSPQAIPLTGTGTVAATPTRSAALR